MTHLSPQITHLVSARPMSVTMGNAIRELKLEIGGLDFDMIEQDVCGPLQLWPRANISPLKGKRFSLHKN